MNALCVTVIVTTHVKINKDPLNVGAKKDTNLVEIKKVAAVIITLIVINLENQYFSLSNQALYVEPL